MARHAILGSASSSDRKASFLRMARECAFSLEILATRLRVSQRTIKRFIRLAYDRSAADWLKEQRLNASLHFLAEYRSVKQAALESGFKQQAHFSREFKKAFHITPSAYLLLREEQAGSFPGQ
jgi:AraC-like DNA-binding protein